jgi:hypothetical protein
MKEAAMRSDSSGNDTRKLWQEQPTEIPEMTLEKIEQKTQELRAKTRRELTKSIAGPVIVAAICVFGLRFPDIAVRAALMVAIAWSIAGQYFFRREMWSAMPPGDAALSTSLQSYRKEVERRRSLFGRAILWLFGPAVLAIGVLIAILVKLGTGPRGLPLEGALRNMAPFLILIVVWVVSFFAIRMRQQRELQREIAELEAIERTQRG